ncbi:glycosyltransferase family protein [Curtobacterium sp. 24E2]|nr:glycosyltransferase [Curtobacterium sp. 24E2]
MSTVQVIAAAMSSRARVVHLHDPELLWAVLLLRLMGRAVVYDAHEDLPDQVRGKEYLAPLARRVGVVVAHVAVRLAGRAHVVIGATPAITRRFPADRTIVVRNVPRIMDDHVPPAPNECAPVAVYVGSLSHDRGLEVLTGVAGSPDLPSGWRIVTAGPIDAAVDRRRFDALVASGHIDHRGVVPPRAARELMSGSRVGLLPLLPTPAYRMSIPTKLFEYMASGTAVVATDVPLWRELLAGSECATWVPPGDPGAVVAALQRYEDDPELLERHAASGRALVRERFRWDREEQELLAVYRKLFGTTPLPEVGTH